VTRFNVTTPGNDGAKGIPKRGTGKENHQRKYRRRQHFGLRTITRAKPLDCKKSPHRKI
jgi:hypothetical protein